MTDQQVLDYLFLILENQSSTFFNLNDKLCHFKVDKIFSKEEGKVVSGFSLFQDCRLVCQIHNGKVIFHPKNRWDDFKRQIKEEKETSRSPSLEPQELIPPIS